MKQCAIYGFRNSINGKWYVGQTRDLATRKRCHFSSLERGDHYNFGLQRDFKTDGRASFEFHIIEVVTFEMLDESERKWISFHRSTDREFGYNIDIGGNSHKIMAEETKRKISLAQKGRIFTEEHRRKISLSRQRPLSPAQAAHMDKLHKAQIGGHPSDEARRKMSESGRQKKLSVEHRLKIGEANKGKHFIYGRQNTPETRLKISLALKGRKRAPFSAEARRNMSLAHMGKKMPENLRLRVIERMTGRTVSEETRRKQSIAQKARFARDKQSNIAA